MNSVWLTRSRTRAVRPFAGSQVLTTYYQVAKLSVSHRSSPNIAISRVRCYSKKSTPSRPNGPGPRVAIIGSGPAGFYTARKLMREVHGTKIDMYEQLPVPFGLVRFGVAPDHPEVKNCQDEFEEVASSPNYNFIGNIQLGQDLPLPILAKHYDAVVFSYGASKDSRLGLEGEEKPHIYSARAFVGWYNGLPEYRDLDPDLKAGKTAIVVGQGNVAMDVARILLSEVSALQKTDLTEYAIQTLKGSQIRHVHVVGRRGPMQASFTIKEVRELIQLPNVNFKPIPSHLFPPDLKSLERPKRRIMELLKKGKPHDPSATKSWSLDFCLAPQALEWSEHSVEELTGVTFTQTSLEDPSSPTSKVTTTDGTSTLATSTLFRSIGYRAEAIPGMKQIGADFNTKTGTLHHDGYGRIIPLDSPENSPVIDEGKRAASLYCAGWVKRGPTGVIASTMTDAFQTAEAIAEDWLNRAQDISSSNGTEPSTELRRGWTAVKADAQEHGYDLGKVVNWEGWKRIDEKEKRIGAERGKPREKIGDIQEMERIARGDEYSERAMVDDGEGGSAQYYTNL